MSKNKAQVENSSANWLLAELDKACANEYNIEAPQYLFLVAMNNVPSWQTLAEKGEYRRGSRVREMDVQYSKEVEAVRSGYLSGSMDIEEIRGNSLGPNFCITSDVEELSRAIDKWEATPESEFDYYDKVNGDLVFVLVEFLWTP